MRKYKVLELFSGSRSIGKVAEKMGMEVFSVDNQDFPNTNWVGDIRDWDYRLNEMNVGELKEEYIPDILWASPPCTGFSVACIGRNWIKGEVFTPKTDSAKLGIEIMLKTMEIIKEYLKLNPNLIWYVENPRGKMRKAPQWDEMDHVRHTISYCKYGDTRMKPTDIWTNDYDWKPKPLCKPFKYDQNGEVINRHCHHDASPRGTQQGGTQKLKGNYERSKLPPQLCEEVLSSAYEFVSHLWTAPQQMESGDLFLGSIIKIK